jgi:hypothetical protein
MGQRSAEMAELLSTDDGPFGRILEIGEHCLIGRGRPDAVDFACTSLGGPPPDLPAGLRRVGPLAAFRKLRAGAYGLVIGHAPADPGWRAPLLRRALRRPSRHLPALFLRSRLAQLIPAQIPLVMLDLEDHPILPPGHLALLDRALICFKRELPADRARAFLRTSSPLLPDLPERLSPAFAARLAKLRPISLALSDAALAAAPSRPSVKTTDIFFAGQVEGSASLRRSGLAELAALAGSGVKVDLPESRLALPEFLGRMAAARLVWSPEGYGHECFRHYEAAACWSVPVINAPGIERHRPLLADIHALYYAVEPGGLARTLRRALREPERLAVMGRAARRHVLRHKTHAALAAYVLEETRRTLASSSAAMSAARRSTGTTVHG